MISNELQKNLKTNIHAQDSFDDSEIKNVNTLDLVNQSEESCGIPAIQTLVSPRSGHEMSNCDIPVVQTTNFSSPICKLNDSCGIPTVQNTKPKSINSLDSPSINSSI